MPAPTPDVARLIREARAAVSAALARSRLARAWELLHVRDADGNLVDPRPYTNAALEELRAAHEQDAEDVRVLHHLAIAQHARAWDLELKGDKQASQAWTEALGHWRRLAASPAFWTALESKLRDCDSQADPSFLGEVRRNLLENLLAVHVDFVRYYCEREEREQAKKHVLIIKSAQIPPVLRHRLTARAFEVLTEALPEARAERAFGPALVTVERFLELFPQHLPALTVYLELCAEWTSGLSYRNDWDALEQLSQRADPIARQLIGHPEVAQEPRASTALEGLADELVQRGYDRTHAFLRDRDYSDFSSAERKELKSGLTLALAWGRLAYPHSPSGSHLRGTFTTCCQNQGWLLNQEQREVESADTDEKSRAATCVTLLREATAWTEVGLACSPGHEGLEANQKILRRSLASWEQRQQLLETANIRDLLSALGEDL